MSKTIRYSSLDEMLDNFKDEKEDLYEELRCSDISWGSEQQVTLGCAAHIHEIIEEHYADLLACAEDAKDEKEIARITKCIATINRIDAGPTIYYCMEE
jgi:hypothetical protein